jgi:hypothetical protein
MKIDRQAVLAKTDGHCAYCGCELTTKTMQVDHVVPVRRWYGRRDGEGTDDINNLLPACRSCNNYKNSMSLENFREAAERWPEVLMRDSVTYKNAVRFGLVEPKPRKVRFYFEQLGGLKADKEVTP